MTRAVQMGSRVGDWDLPIRGLKLDAEDAVRVGPGRGEGCHHPQLLHLPGRVLPFVGLSGDGSHTTSVNRGAQVCVTTSGEH